MSANLQIEARPLPSVTVLELHGDVTADGEDAIVEAYQSAVDDGPDTVLLEMTDATYINTSGISVLITLAMDAKKAGQHILVSGASAHYQKVFDLVRFSSFVSMFQTEDEALASLA
jgi:anti-anti-sigma factor